MRELREGKNQQDGFAIMTSHEPTVHSSYAGILGVSSSSHPSIGYAMMPKVKKILGSVILKCTFYIMFDTKYI